MPGEWHVKRLTIAVHIARLLQELENTHRKCTIFSLAKSPGLIVLLVSPLDTGHPYIMSEIRSRSLSLSRISR